LRALRQFAIESRGQDLIEYVLLLALMVIATTAMLVTAGQSLSAVWNAPIFGTASSGTSTDLH
jgi:Flp pilus assembly pilin Flp